MATAAAPSFHSTKETTNYARLCRLLVDVSARILRETFEKRRPTGDLHTVLLSPPVHAVLQPLRKKGILNPSQWEQLYPKAIKSAISSKNFDITLLMVLLRNICGLVRPATGWDTLPPATETTLEADIVRIKCYRNTVYGHASEASVDDPTFNQYWKDIQDALVRLGGAGYQSTIDDLKKECIDPDFEEHSKELLKQWVAAEVSIKERLDEMAEHFEHFDKSLDELKDAIVSPIKKPGDKVVSAYTNVLKESIKKQTEFINLASPTSSNKNPIESMQVDIAPEGDHPPLEDSFTFESATLDHDVYASNYTSLTKLNRLMFVAKHCPSLEVDALRIALCYVKQMFNVQPYQEIVMRMTEACSHSELECPAVDATWIEAAPMVIYYFCFDEQSPASFPELSLKA